LERADVVLLALPIQALVAWLEEWGGKLPRGTVVVDVGSTKREIVRAMEALPEGVDAVGAHPMAGSEESGMGAARPDLFHGSRWALVETGRTGDRAREVAEAIVGAVGARPFWTGADVHDRATAATSHLPYLLSAALARHLAGRAEEAPVRELLGPGARDMLRLAGSDPTVMSGILSTNWPEVREEVARFRDVLGDLAEELDRRAGGGADAGAEGGAGDVRAASLRQALESVRRERNGLIDTDRGLEPAPERWPGRATDDGTDDAGDHAPGDADAERDTDPGAGPDGDPARDTRDRGDDR
jgi:prephenate dehydrogenase